jgi:guanine deaminase
MDYNKIFLARAIELASDNINEGGGPFGAVIVKDNQIISEAGNRVVLNSDPTAHAEILAIRTAATRLKSHELSECILYSSCEPCPMCLGAIYWSGIKKVVYACDRHDAESAGFSDKLIYDEINIDPSSRTIPFIRINESGGNDVFRKWDKLENKTSY